MSIDDMTVTRKLYGTKLKRNAKILTNSLIDKIGEVQSILNKPTEICSAVQSVAQLT